MCELQRHELEVNKERITHTVVVRDGDVVLLGRDHLFRMLMETQVRDEGCRSAGKLSLIHI